MLLALVVVLAVLYSSTKSDLVVVEGAYPPTAKAPVLSPAPVPDCRAVLIDAPVANELPSQVWELVLG